MSKGSARRKEDIAKIWNNWDQIFGKKDKPQEEEPKQEQQSAQEPHKENAK